MYRLPRTVDGVLCASSLFLLKKRSTAAVARPSTAGHSSASALHIVDAQVTPTRHLLLLLCPEIPSIGYEIIPSAMNGRGAFWQTHVTRVIMRTPNLTLVDKYSYCLPRITQRRAAQHNYAVPGYQRGDPAPYKHSLLPKYSTEDVNDRGNISSRNSSRLSLGATDLTTLPFFAPRQKHGAWFPNNMQQTMIMR